MSTPITAGSFPGNYRMVTGRRFLALDDRRWMLELDIRRDVWHFVCQA